MAIDHLGKLKEECNRAVAAFRDDVPQYTLTELVQKITKGSRACQYPDKSRPSLVVISVETDFYTLAHRFVNMIRSNLGLSELDPFDADGIREANTLLEPLIERIGYNIHLVEVSAPINITSVLHAFDTKGRVVGISLDVMEM